MKKQLGGGKKIMSCSFYLYRFRKYVSYGFPIINFSNPGVYYETPCTSTLIIYLRTCSVDLKLKTFIPLKASGYFRHQHTHMLIHVLVWPEEQMDETWEPSNQQRSFGKKKGSAG